MLPLASLLFAGCAMQQDSFPSLSKRAIEDIPAEEPKISPDVNAVASLPNELQREVDAAVDQSDAAHRNFLADLSTVESSVSAGRNAEPSSESWVVAQMQLAALETRRSPSISALADLDALYFRRLESEFSDNPPGGAALIDRSRKQVAQQVEMQQRKIDELKAVLR